MLEIRFLTNYKRVWYVEIYKGKLVVVDSCSKLAMITPLTALHLIPILLVILHFFRQLAEKAEKATVYLWRRCFESRKFWKGFKLFAKLEEAKETVNTRRLQIFAICRKNERSNVDLNIAALRRGQGGLASIHHLHDSPSPFGSIYLTQCTNYFLV